MRWPSFALIAVSAGLAGCRQSVPENAATPPPDQETRLGDKIDVSISDWLKLPRAQLAKLSDENAVTVQKQQEAARLNADSVDLLPQLHAPVRVPVFERCSYAPAAGFSLPPYLAGKAHDPAMAVHLARHGDDEAALRLAGPDNADLQRELAAWRCERNYPLEWTRLVALALQAAQFKMAHGDPEGATEVVALHKQVREVLDPKAARGPLGAALLPLGRHALELAVAAWRDPKVNKPALAGDVEAALKEWGDMPDPVAGLAPDAARADVAALFGQQVGAGRGGRPAARAFCAVTPDATARALDLLALPLAPEGVTAVVALLDDRDRLHEVLAVYEAKVNELFPEPVHLAHHLVDHGFTCWDAKREGLPRQVYTGAGRAYEITALTRGRAGGAVVRVGPASMAGDKLPAAVFARDPRDWGVVNLDRSYDVNRVNLDPNASGGSVKVDKAATLRKIDNPVTDTALAGAELTRELTQDVVGYLALSWPADLSHDALHHIAPPLWAAFGPARWEAHEESRGGYLQLTWEAENTRIKLRLPYDEQPPELIAEDSRGTTDLAARAEAAQKHDLQDRRDRLAAGKPQVRLPRSLQLNSPAGSGLQIEGLRLGMGRDEALAVLPSSQMARTVTIKGAAGLLFVTEPLPGVPYWARQLFLRFGPGDRVAEIRVRYQEPPPRADTKGATLLETFRAAAGSPQELPGSWAGLWTDLGPSGHNPVLYRWRDDLTLLTLQRDRCGAEVTLRDCPPDAPLGVNLGPLQFCKRGTDTCGLGDARTDVLKRFGLSQPPAVSDGADVLGQPEDSPYDLLLVWYDQGRVSRIIARHRTGQPARAQEAAGAVVAAWAQNIDTLGYPRRVEGQRGQVLASYGWHDDVTRIRIFVQDTQQGPRLFTEFRGWPVPPTRVASGQ
jgi:hypothetical protein